MDLRISSATAERAEGKAIYDAAMSLDTDTRRKLGVEVLRVGGGVALSVRADSTHLWNRALGFGFTRAVTRDLIEQLALFYRAQGVVTATIQIAPSAMPADWDVIRAREGLSRGPRVVKLAREIDIEAPPADAGQNLRDGLRVGPVGSADEAECVAVRLRAFDVFDECTTALVSATVRAEGWHPFAVWDGDRIIATAGLHIHEDTARFLGGATLPEHRRHGAQAALIAARIQAARAAGCRWLVADTGPEIPGSRNSSLRNLRRAGFEVLYERTDWIWRASGAREC
jgi:GNAT superfamily N-acetyltransferase